jgi:hypothetical protein
MYPFKWRILQRDCALAWYVMLDSGLGLGCPGCTAIRRRRVWTWL